VITDKSRKPHKTIKNNMKNSKMNNMDIIILVKMLGREPHDSMMRLVNPGIKYALKMDHLPHDYSSVIIFLKKI